MMSKHILTALAAAVVSAIITWFIIHGINSDRYYLVSTKWGQVPVVFRIDKHTGNVHRITVLGKASEVKFPVAEERAPRR